MFHTVFLTCLAPLLTAAWLRTTLFSQDEPESDYEKLRKQTMAKNKAHLDLLDKVRLGVTVHIPQSVFPDDPAPPEGFWIGKTVSTTAGGTGDVGIEIPGEEIFTRPRSEVAGWVVSESV